MNSMILGTTALLLTVPAVAQVQPVPPIASVPMTHGKNATQTRDEALTKVRGHFARMDVNLDGFIAGDELKVASGQRQEMSDARKERRQQAAFEWLDRNRDNMISRSEYGSFRQPRGQSMGGRGTAPTVMPGDRPGGGHQMGGSGMMRMADLNRDGRISLEELTTSALQRFDRMDANRDGRVTPEERQQQRQMRKQERGRTL